MALGIENISSRQEEPIKRFVSLIYKSFFMIKNNQII